MAAPLGERGLDLRLREGGSSVDAHHKTAVGNTLVDAHVHIHDCFSLPSFLDAAFENFRCAAMECRLGWPAPCLLMFTETVNAHYFNRLHGYADGDDTSALLGDWRLSSTGEEMSLLAQRRDGACLTLVAGRQIITGERLEVLALATTATFPDGEPIRHVLAEVTRVGSVPVIPWGFGKWSGRRGRIVNSLLREPDVPRFSLGDNSGRLRMFPEPAEFGYARDHDIKILPGTDPLPFPSQADRAGSFGFWIDRTVSDATPAADLRGLLDDVPVNAFGRGEGLVRFGINQVAMQVVKRVGRRTAGNAPGKAMQDG